MTRQLPSVCNSCIHRTSETACAAFPRIPEEFITWGEPHDTPTSSQKNRIVWEFAPGTEPEFQAWKELQQGS